MRIEILDQAERDLVEGFRFYEEQGEGLGSYFLTNLYADIDSLHLSAGIHNNLISTITGFYQGDFPLLSFTRYERTASLSTRFWTAVAIRLGSVNDFCRFGRHYQASVSPVFASESPTHILRVCRDRKRGTRPAAYSAAESLHSCCRRRRPDHDRVSLRIGRDMC